MDCGPLDGRVAIVTGGTRNIGLATATRLAREGADVVVTGRDPGALSRAAELIRDAGGTRVLSLAVDVTDPGRMAVLGRAVLDELGRVDIVVNNTLVVAKGAYQDTAEGASLLTAPRAMWDEGFDGYVHGPLALLREVVPSMRAGGHGAVVNLVSTANFRIVEGLGVYGVVKAALWSMTRYLAAELAPDVRVNAVCPGTVSESGDLVEERQAVLLEKVALKRMGRADEVAAAVQFLASDASSYTTGQVIVVDGGRVALG